MRRLQRPSARRVSGSDALKQARRETRILRSDLRACSDKVDRLERLVDRLRSDVNSLRDKIRS
ncbi:MAG TPA: hypothetical protein VFB07_06940 [Vicinamibacterales bacterium]|nr:hypothetical protein [Vicinamibacterales bacterium]